MDLQISEAREEDIPLLLQFIRDFAEFEKMIQEVKVDEESLRDSILDPENNIHVVIGRCHGEAVGYAAYFFNFSTFLGRPGLYLEDLWVKPQWRGHGFGKAILLHLARIARDRNCGRMEWAVLDWNQRSMAFFENLGGRRIEGWTFYRMERDALDNLD